MNKKSQRQALLLARPDDPFLAETALSLPISLAITQQLEVDRFCLDAIDALNPTEAEHTKIAALVAAVETRTSWTCFFRDPAFLGLILGLFLFVGLSAWLLMNYAGKFSGQEQIENLLKSTPTGIDFEPISTDMQGLEDWFALKGFDDYWVPKSFAKEQAVGVRIFLFEGVKIAAVLLPEHHIMVYIFNGDAFGMRPAHSAKWQFFQSGEDAGALLQKENLCFVASIHGDQKKLKETFAKIVK